MKNTILKVLKVLIVFIWSSMLFIDAVYAKTDMDVIRKVFNIDSFKATDKELKDAIKRMPKQDKDAIELRLMQIEALRTYNKKVGGELSSKAIELLRKTEDIGISDAIIGAVIPDPQIGLLIGEGLKIIGEARGLQYFEIYSSERDTHDKDTAWKEFIQLIGPTPMWRTDEVHASFEFLYTAIKEENKGILKSEMDRVEKMILTNVNLVRERDSIVKEENKRPWWKQLKAEAIKQSGDIALHLLGIKVPVFGLFWPKTALAPTDKLDLRTAGDIQVNVTFTQELSGLYTQTPDYFLARGANWNMTNISGTRTGEGSIPGLCCWHNQQCGLCHNHTGEGQCLR